MGHDPSEIGGEAEDGSGGGALGRYNTVPRGEVGEGAVGDAAAAGHVALSGEEENVGRR